MRAQGELPVLQLDDLDDSGDSDWIGVLVDENEDELAHNRLDERPWMLWVNDEGLEVRLGLDFTGSRIVISDVWIRIDPDTDRSTAIAAADLRDVPLGRISAVINSPVTATAIHTAFGYFPEDHPTLPLGPDFDYDPTDAYRLPGVEQKRRPDSFYAAVALAWATAVARGNREPAAVLAEANDVPRSTVYGWVRQARRRGVMAPSGQRPRTKKT